METKSKTFQVQVPMYGLEAVYKASYSFLEKAYVRLEGDPAGTVKVSFRPKVGEKASIDSLVGEFENELLHQALRVKVADGSRKIREFIVTRALLSAQGVASTPATPAPAGNGAQAQAPAASSSVLDEELEKEIEKLLAEVEKAGSGGGDPLNIAVPWEEKNGAPKPATLAGEKVAAAESGGGCGSGCGCGSEGGHTHGKKGNGDAFEV